MIQAIIVDDVQNAREGLKQDVWITAGQQSLLRPLGRVRRQLLRETTRRRSA